eukprot:748838-Hanusia_phi.AAC.7
MEVMRGRKSFQPTNSPVAASHRLKQLTARSWSLHTDTRNSPDGSMERSEQESRRCRKTSGVTFFVRRSVTVISRQTNDNQSQVRAFHLILERFDLTGRSEEERRQCSSPQLFPCHPARRCICEMHAMPQTVVVD